MQEPQWQPSHDLEERLRQPLSLTEEQFLDILIRDSRYTSFWFDDGVGPFKNKAYSQFWCNHTAQTSSGRDMELLPSEKIKGKLIFDKLEQSAVIVKLHRIKSSEPAPWVILGDWIIGKETAP